MPETTTPSRIYVIAPKASTDPVRRRLVRAVNATQALRHVASEFVVAVASQDDLVALIGDGVTVETAGAEAEPAAAQAEAAGLTD